MSSDDTAYEGWSIMELMGHRPQPVNRWELPALPPSANAEDDDSVVDAY